MYDYKKSKDHAVSIWKHLQKQFDKFILPNNL